MRCLWEEVEQLDHELLIKGFDHIDFYNLNTNIIQYTVSCPPPELRLQSMNSLVYFLFVIVCVRRQRAVSPLP